MITMRLVMNIQGVLIKYYPGPATTYLCQMFYLMAESIYAGFVQAARYVLPALWKMAKAFRAY